MDSGSGGVAVVTQLAVFRILRALKMVRLEREGEGKEREREGERSEARREGEGEGESDQRLGRRYIVIFCPTR